MPLPAPEKKALDAAFLATLVASLAAPFATKDPGAIWWVDALVVGAGGTARAACYALDMHSGVALAPHTAPYARVNLARQIR